MKVKKVLITASLFLTLGLVAKDSYTKFSSESILLKRQNKSAQRHWNLFYGQRYVYEDSSFKYAKDMGKLSELVAPGSVVLSDISTSYYLAAEIPVFVKNIHRHHRGSGSGIWASLLRSKHACYLDQPERYAAFMKFIDQERNASTRPGNQPLRYFVVNKDQINLNMRNDCLSQRRTAFIKNADGFAKLAFDGTYLMLYELD